MVFTKHRLPAGQLSLHAFFKPTKQRKSFSCQKNKVKPLPVVVVPKNSSNGTINKRKMDDPHAPKLISQDESSDKGCGKAQPARKSPRVQLLQQQSDSQFLNDTSHDDCSASSCSGSNGDASQQSAWEPSDESGSGFNNHAASAEGDSMQDFVCSDSHVSHEDVDSDEESSFHSTSESE